MSDQTDKHGLTILVDADACYAGDDLSLLLSFSSVPGIHLEHAIVTELDGATPAEAVLGDAGAIRVRVPSRAELSQRAARLTRSSGAPLLQVERALLLEAVGRVVAVDALVSPVAVYGGGGAFGIDRLITVQQCLALVGAHVRQREVVPLGSAPPLTQLRTEVYPLTARLALDRGQEWWTGCVASGTAVGDKRIEFGQAVFSRAGQALRGRDSLHEALRQGNGRTAILEALYHLDVILMSSVAALDASARVVDIMLTLDSKPIDVGWQRDKWLRKVAAVQPKIAEPFLPGGLLRTHLLLITRVRNSIHGIPLDEYLHVEPARGGVEHRVMMSGDLTAQLLATGATPDQMVEIGIHSDGPSPTSVNLGQYAEWVLAQTYAILGSIFGNVLDMDIIPAGRDTLLNELEFIEWDRCARLAQVGGYPRLHAGIGLRASPAYRTRVMGAIHRATMAIEKGKGEAE